MRLILYIFVFICFVVDAFSQECKYCENHPVYTKLIIEADSCLDNYEEHCISMYKAILEKGRSENVNFVDFLYFKYVRSFMVYEKFDSTIYHGYNILNQPTEFDADVMNMMANAFMMLGQIDSSVHYMIEAASILEERKDSVHLAYVYTNLGIIIGEMGNNPLSIDYHKKSFFLQKKLNNSEYLSTVASNIALGYYHQGEKDSTRLWAEKSIEIADTTDDTIGRLYAYYSLALIENDLNKRLNYAKETMELSKLSNQKNMYADALYLYASTLNSLGRNKEAMKYADESYDMNVEVSKRSGIMKSAFIAADIYFENQYFEKAADYYRIYIAYKDSLLTEDNRLLVNELSTKYETKKKENQLLENELLINKKNTQIRFGIIVGLFSILSLVMIIIQYKRRQKNKIEKLEKEKEITVLRAWMNGEERERNRISRDLHDGVASMLSAAKLNLQTIPYLSHERAEIQLKKVSDILEHTHNDVRRIAHNLLPIVLEQEGFEKAIEQFVSHVNETGILFIEIERTGNVLPEFDRSIALMLYRIVQELINNIVKHAQANRAQIKIDYNSNDQLTIEIIDNGIGFESNKHSQGLFSVKERLMALGGTFDIEGSMPKGTRALLKVQLN